MQYLNIVQKYPDFYEEVIYHFKYKQDHTLNEKIKLMDANTEMTEILELFDKYFKTTIIKCFSEQL